MRLILSVFTSVFLVFSAAHASEENSIINFNISLDCPPSVEREALESIIPPPDYQSPNLEEWIQTTLNELDHVRTLVQSGHFKNATVNFGSNSPTAIDESQLSSARISLQLICLNCSELEHLKALSLCNEKNLSYAQWSANAMDALQNLQMLILKGNVVAVNSQRFNNNIEQPLTEITCKLDIKAPRSEEFQALLEVLSEDNQTFENYHEWSVDTINTIHKLERLILSGKINLANGSIDVGDTDSSM
ncbi:MAG: hypothetical protein KFB93_04345 [Simkaniaceae bacterium]|nr:MAG: hypothetical protein KFB93_04345 [Simkaniaceae bacterium]